MKNKWFSFESDGVSQWRMHAVQEPDNVFYIPEFGETMDITGPCIVVVAPSATGGFFVVGSNRDKYHEKIGSSTWLFSVHTVPKNLKPEEIEVYKQTYLDLAIMQYHEKKK